MCLKNSRSVLQHQNTTLPVRRTRNSVAAGELPGNCVCHQMEDDGNKNLFHEPTEFTPVQVLVFLQPGIRYNICLPNIRFFTQEVK
jgi:hypothetical protein